MAVGDLYTGITVQGLYNEQTGDKLFGVVGSAAPASALAIAGSDGTNLRLLSVDATGKVNVNASITPPSDNTSTGTLTNPGDTVVISTEGTSALMVQITLGAAITAGSILFEVSLDGTTYQSQVLYPVVPDGSPAVSSTTTAGNWTLPVGGFRNFRVRASGTFAGGPATIVETAGQGQYSVFNYSDNYANFLATAKITDGTNTAAVTAANALKVDGSAVTQPVSGTVTANAGTGTFRTAPDGTIWALTGTSANVDVTNTVTVSGTVTANQGTTPWAVAPDGTTWALTGTSANVDVTNTVTVTGTVAVTQSTSPWVVAGNLTNNNAAPGAANVGVLPALANAASPTWTEGDQVLESVDLTGRQRVRGTLSTNNAAPTGDNIGVLPAVVASGTFPATTLPALTAGDQALVSITQGGSLRVIPADEANAASINYFSADQGDAQTSIANPAVKPLISIRTNSASILVQLRQISILGGGQLVRYQLIKNATLTGATFAATSPSANTQVDTAATSFSGGTVVDSGYFGSTQFLKSMIYAMAAGTPGDRYTLAASSISGTVKVSGAIQWSEQSAAI